MKVILALLVLVAIVHAAVPFYRAELSRRIPNSYIVQFNHTEPVAAAAYMTKLAGLGYQIDRQYSFETFHGVAVTINKNEDLSLLLNDETNILHVEEDQMMSLGSQQQTCVTAQNQEWNLARVSHRTMEDAENYATYYHPSHGASDVHAYIVDTGILLKHNEFGGRAHLGGNFVDNQNDDCNGHGTHVAGTVGGSKYGIAKNVKLVAVKVLNCQGSGSNAGVIEGVVFVGTDGKNKKCTANMSLGGGYSAALNSAVESAVTAGCTFVVAAGNENQNACNVSPASEPSAITVGSTAQEANGASESQDDVRSPFSNWGSCVDIFAPGSSIRSAWIGSVDRLNTISGTSMAAPHVCGVASLLKSAYSSYTPAQITQLITDSATTGVITMNCGSSACNQSPNKLLFTDCSI